MSLESLVGAAPTKKELQLLRGGGAASAAASLARPGEITRREFEELTRDDTKKPSQNQQQQPATEESARDMARRAQQMASEGERLTQQRAQKAVRSMQDMEAVIPKISLTYSQEIVRLLRMIRRMRRSAADSDSIDALIRQLESFAGGTSKTERLFGYLTGRVPPGSVPDFETFRKLFEAMWRLQLTATGTDMRLPLRVDEDAGRTVVDAAGSVVNETLLTMAVAIATKALWVLE